MTAGSLTRSVPSRTRSPGRSVRATARRNLRRLPGRKLPMVPPRNATPRGPLSAGGVVGGGGGARPGGARDAAGHPGDAPRGAGGGEPLGGQLDHVLGDVEG